MNVFDLRDRLIEDYSAYIRSFIRIQDERIGQHVDESLDGGLLWPDPLIQLNPSFEPGEWIDELVSNGTLHAECARIFRIKPDPSGQGKPLRLHRHQADAVRAARGGNNYVLTTGTGSGKSLAYIVPIVDHVLRRGSGRGIQAIVVYPMNALANSQFGELQKFLCHGFPDGRPLVTFERYTGQEGDEKREQIKANPPDILLTNYVMLELILTRPVDRPLVDAAQGLQFLVLDELHTYRGRQGADVAFLARRVRDATAADRLQCVGTSATLVSTGNYDQQRAEVARVASLLFGDTVRDEHVVGETLRRATHSEDISDPAFIGRLRQRLNQPAAEPQSHDIFRRDPLAIWIENTFGVTTEVETGRLIRSTPRRISGEDGAARQLNELTGVSAPTCAQRIQEGLLAGYNAPHPETGFPTFAFRLHQFISRGDTVYASLEAEASRHITVYGQQFVPGDRSRVLLPLVFCRECGREYFCVRSMKDPQTGQKAFVKRELYDRFSDDESDAGFLYRSQSKPWPSDPEQIRGRLPDDWLEEQRGQLRIRASRTEDLPRLVRVKADGLENPSGLEFHYLGSPFRFCLDCGVAYGARQSSDFAKLTSLGSEGRSTATTILSLSLIRNLRNKELALKKEARKLLSFTDNRQDASLQAGHLNDFVEVGLLRSALFKAASAAGPQGVAHEQLTQKVFDALNLPLVHYASDPDVRFAALDQTHRALREVLGYRIYRDLQRGWRITSPNLEQCGLLEIRYASLQELCAAEDIWQDCHPALVSASPERRQRISRVLLDYMRRELAIKVDYLNREKLEQIQQLSNQHLKAPWALDENEKRETAAILFPRPSRLGDYGGHIFLSGRGGFGQFLRRPATLGTSLTLEETQTICRQLLEALRAAGLVEIVLQQRDDQDVAGYQLPASAMIWTAGDGTRTFHDPIRVPNRPEEGGHPNPFFVNFYRNIAAEALGLEAREHTAQVPAAERVDREERFRRAALPVLYCSPTMELGVDISELNAVNMRNIPPTPANYAQRSGRAGRSGQPALVFSYCSTGSSHDQYFFKRPSLMVSGAVSPPRLDLDNEDLIRAHVHAIWLAETRQSLYSTLKDILDLTGSPPSLAIQDVVRDSIESEQARRKAHERARRIMDRLADILENSDWYSERWLDEVMAHVVRQFDASCERWRSLYLAAAHQRETQNRIIGDHTRSAQDREQATRLRREAESQLELLTESLNVSQSDFYSYRYFASEGFLPGYNFPRLPLSAFIPGRQRTKGRDEFLSRPRFLAISEFGPRSFVYHEGSRYIIHKVILPIAGDEQPLTTSAKQCSSCGYLHPLAGGLGPDLCQHCGAALGDALKRLFRLQNVATKRRDRISSDEEERLRLGFEIITGVRFAERAGVPVSRRVDVRQGETTLATLTYGAASTLWRINLGWTRRKEKSQLGFVLDLERGYWARNQMMGEDDPDDPMSGLTRRVIPYVEDRRNSLLLDPGLSLAPEQMASLQAALKNAIQVHFQLEDSELAAEPLPSRNDRRAILFYESAEGGVGALRRLQDEIGALAAVARKALELCHFDPETGADRRRAESAREDCEAACYDCLMSYGNQTDHEMLDRQLIRQFLLSLAQGQILAAPSAKPRAEHLESLLRQAGSELEKNWLRYLNENDYRLPSRAQYLIESCRARPDFFYEECHTAVFIDGPVHEYPERQSRDRAQTEAMEDSGLSVIRFCSSEEWPAVVARYPHVFGKPS